jgi:hypothetical protein
MFAVLYNDGALTFGDVINSCHAEKWVPLYTYRTVANPDAVKIVCFENEKDVKKFAKLNLPKDWLVGAVQLSKAEMMWCAAKGWKLVMFSKPMVMRKRTDLTVGHEVIEFSESPGVCAKRK